MGASLHVASQVVELPWYAVHVVHGGLPPAVEEILRGAHRCAVVSDDTVAGLYADRVRAALPDASVYTVPPGEREKNRERWAQLTDAMLADGHARDSIVVALGGGVIGDLAGFVAATYMRGVPYVQFPTTLLAMVDASVGGKTGVDTSAGKNLLGAFHRPVAVVADTATLATLPVEHRRAGLAEAIKHGVIADAAYLERVVALAPAVVDGTAEADDLVALVADSVRIKGAVVMRDEHERGERRTLNFGHTIAHAIEVASAYAVSHGDAVAIGMVAESRAAERAGVAERGTAAAVERAVVAAGLPTALPAGMSIGDVLAATATDKKRDAGSVLYAVPARVGAMAESGGRWGVPLDAALLEGALR